MSEWKSVRDDPPPERQRVLVRWPKGGLMYFNPCIALRQVVTGCTHDVWTYEPDFVEPREPTEWMELP